MRKSSFLQLAILSFCCLLMLLPNFTLFWIACTKSSENFFYLIKAVLPLAAKNTFLLLILTGGISICIGVLHAWIITSFDFSFRRTLSWMVALPLASPPYLVAYALSEFFDYMGPVQTSIRHIGGFHSMQDYWFPDLHSIGGASIVFSSVLYPYIYLTTRTVLLIQGQKIAEIAKTLGAGSLTIFFKILLPLSYPAIISGTILVLMETLNDIGASEYLGVQTLTSSVYVTWLNRENLGGAAQISLIILVFIFLILFIKNQIFRHQRLYIPQTTHLKAKIQRKKLHGYSSCFVILFLCIPILTGFGIPLFIFAKHALHNIEKGVSILSIYALCNSLFTATLTAFLTVIIVLFFANITRFNQSILIQYAIRITTIGYAIPGGILALGLLFIVTTFDNFIDQTMIFLFHQPIGLFFSGSIFIVILGCTIRFLSIAESTISSGLTKLPPNLDNAARILGCTATQSFLYVLFPLLLPAICTAAFLVFVDSIKELSVTILLRPFGFNTLATYIYENASRGAPEKASLEALFIMASSVLPVIFLSKALADDKDNILFKMHT